MKVFRDIFICLIDSGITPKTTDTDTKYLRFFNATMLLFGMAQLPVLMLLVTLELWTQLIVNLTALVLCGLGFILNRGGHYLSAKSLFLLVVTANASYFAVIMGSSAPTHLWLVPMAVMGVLLFKPTEWVYMLVTVGLAMLCFLVLELVYLDLEPIVRQYQSSAAAQQAAHGSTIFAIMLTLILVGMMHRRFAKAERSIYREKAQSERLLRAILPDKIAKELSETGSSQAVRYENVSVLFADIVGFTPLAASMPAENVVALLASVFERFDSLIEECGVEKIKTIGDAYMVAAGVPEKTEDHPERMVRCAQGMLKIIREYDDESGHPLQIRIGIHSGPAVAGVIGTTKFAYDLWGESVNLASRLESSGEPGRIHVSSEFRANLNDKMKFKERGEISIKGVGLTRTHWLENSAN